MKNFPIFSLYVICDENAGKGRDIIDICKTAIEGGAKIIQLRLKNYSSRDLFKKALNLKKALKDKDVLFIINDRPDIAIAVDADGVHLGPTDLPINAARKILGKEKIIGATVKNPIEAKEAEKEGANYVAASHVFPTKTKIVPYPPIGIEGIKAIKEAVSIPVVAISGINKNNAKQVIEAGADVIAVCSSVVSADDPKTAAKEIIQEIQKGKKKRDDY